jgi:hypothetical protein
MECTTARTWLFRSIDDELSAGERQELQRHLAQCVSCEFELNLLTVPRRIARMTPAFTPSPYFYSKLETRIGSESQGVTFWQIILGLSRHILPALAVLTLTLVSIFAYEQLKGPQVDVYQAYDDIFRSGDHPHRMVIADQVEITDESVLHALAEEEGARQTGAK